MTLVAGGLHLYFYTFRKQGDDVPEIRRPTARKAKAAAPSLCADQLLDNMFWTLASGGVPVWTAYEVLMMWAFANGYLPAITWGSPIRCGSSPCSSLIPIWETFYFYLIHRALHWPPLYRLAHALHHRNTNVGPWSGLSMHPIEHVMYFRLRADPLGGGGLIRCT